MDLDVLLPGGLLATVGAGQLGTGRRFSVFGGELLSLLFIPHFDYIIIPGSHVPWQKNWPFNGSFIILFDGPVSAIFGGKGSC